MSQRWIFTKGLESENPADGPFGELSMKLPTIAAASQAAAAAANKGNIYYDETSSAVVVSDGTSWTALSTTAGVGTLEQVTTAGASSTVASITLSGAADAASAFTVGDGTANMQVYGDGTDVNLATDAGDLKIAPAGGDVSITGNVAASGEVKGATVVSTGAATLASCSVTGALTAGTFNADALAAATAGHALALDGDGAGGVLIGQISTGAIALGADTVVDASKSLTITGVANSDMLIMSAGDAVMSDGSLSITDADNAASIVLTNDSYVDAAAGLIDINAGGIVTGTLLNMKADALTSGSMVYLETSAAGFVGKYIQCYDGAADDFSVGLYGATIIAGNAAGTAALTVSAGDLKLSAGVIDQDIVTDHANVFTRAQGTTTKDFVQILCTEASDDHAALYVKHDGTGAVPAVEIVSAGSDSALSVSSSAAAGSAASFSCAANATDSIVKLDGATNDFIGADGVGLLNVSCDGALAHANASCLNIAYSGGGAASGLGTSLRIVDTGSTASSYAVYISAATGEALNVAAGKSVFAEQVELSGGFKTTTGAFVLSDSGAASLDLDGNAANDTFNIGSSVATDVVFHGADAGVDITFDASEDALEFAAGAALVLPQGTSSGGTGKQEVTGSIFYETDAKKLWVYDGAGWVGVQLA